MRRFSPEVTRVFRVLGSDIGRPVTHLSHTLVDFDPVGAARSVQRRDRVSEHEVRAVDGRWYLIRVLPYYIGPRTF